jgi:hypothetical protein
VLFAYASIGVARRAPSNAHLDGELRPRSGRRKRRQDEGREVSIFLGGLNCFFDQCKDGQENLLSS